MDYSKISEDLSLSLEEIRDLVEYERNRMTVEAVKDMMSSICKQNTPNKFMDAPPIARTAYIARESYIIGFVVALHDYSEAIKAHLNELETEEEGEICTVTPAPALEVFHYEQKRR